MEGDAGTSRLNPTTDADADSAPQDTLAAADDDTVVEDKAVVDDRSTADDAPADESAAGDAGAEATADQDSEAATEGPTADPAPDDPATGDAAADDPPTGDAAADNSAADSLFPASLTKHFPTNALKLLLNLHPLPPIASTLGLFPSMISIITFIGEPSFV